MLQMYGIKNCDTVKKARSFCEKQAIDYQFHDFKKTPPTKLQIETWLKQIDWQTLLNMRGMTWRRLAESEKENINKTRAIKLMLANPSIIKRPVVEVKHRVLVGFAAKTYQQYADKND